MNSCIHLYIYFDCSYFVVLHPHDLFMIFLSPIFYSMAAQTRTGSPRYPTFVTTTKPQMGCIRYIQIWILRPYEFYIINISGFWYASLTSRSNKRDFFHSFLSLYFSISFSLFLSSLIAFFI